MTSRNQLPFARCFLSGHLERNMFLIHRAQRPKYQDPTPLIVLLSLHGFYLNVQGPGHDYLYSGSLVGYGTLGHSASKGMLAAS